jgi:hypothetical protein
MMDAKTLATDSLANLADQIPHSKQTVPVGPTRVLIRVPQLAFFIFVALIFVPELVRAAALCFRRSFCKRRKL